MDFIPIDPEDEIYFNIMNHSSEKVEIKTLASNENVTVLHVKKSLDKNPDEKQRIEFLDNVMWLIAKNYPSLPATYYVERHLETLDVIIVIRHQMA